MKLITVDGDDRVFRLGRRERRLLEDVLRQYPAIPEDHHRYSRGGATPRDAANQALLEEFMREHRAELRRRVEAWLQNPAQLVSDEGGFRLRLNREETEWLLQVLNDVRVGNWLAAGSPDPDADQPPVVTEKNARALLLMELAGHFESVLLEEI